MQGFVLISDPEQLRELCTRLQAARRVGLDTEFIPERTYEPVLCLVQVTDGERLAVVDALAIPELTTLWRALLRPDCELVVHAGREELSFCWTQTNELPASVFDVQLAAGLVGLGYPLSHCDLVRRLLGVALQPPQARTDWRRRPLSTQQLDYALNDVRYLLAMREKLGRRLEEMGRLSWFAQETAALLREIAGQPSDERWRRVRGAGGLSPRELAILRELFHWRENRARRLNRPVRQVLPDHLLVALAQTQPGSTKELEAVRGFGTLAGAGWAAHVLEAILRGKALPLSDCPAPARARRETAQEAMALKILSAATMELARANAVAPGLLATNADLRRLLHWHAAGSVPDHAPALAHGWRAEVCGNRLVDLLDGKLIIRLRGDPTGPTTAFEPAHGGG